jgi:hypothetical protein
MFINYSTISSKNMAADNKEGLETARELMDDFAVRTGLSGTEGNIKRRYLWTDAFAVQAFFALSHALDAPAYREHALKLIESVHQTLGRHRDDDGRSGWISGLSAEEGEKHPTIGGLRIGKELPERKPYERFNEQMEWDRDGQYFHYLTRWINALLQAARETGEDKYALWAAELSQAGTKFIDNDGGHMYWKMSIDLSRPLVQSMGAHDPLEGLICAISTRKEAPDAIPAPEQVIIGFRRLCAGGNWSTTDPLGIGGLLLNTARVAELSVSGVDLPDQIKSQKLWSDSLYGLKLFSQRFNISHSAAQRLAFRECGLSLGLRALAGWKGKSATFDKVDKFIPLADNIEAFWSDPNNQRYSTWKEHLDINEVSLASSLAARFYPLAFG